MSRNTIRGWCMERLLECGPAGIGIPACTGRRQELDSALAFVLVFLGGLGGVGTTGTLTGGTTISVLITTTLKPTAGPFSTTRHSIAAGAASTIAGRTSVTAQSG